MPAENHHKIGDIVTDVASFTNRWVETIVIDEVNNREGETYRSVRAGSMGFGVNDNLPRPLVVGGTYVLETHKGQVSGLLDRDGYLFHKSDEHFADKHEKWLKKYEEERNHEWEEHHEDWERRTEALPEPFKGLLNRTREDRPEFEREGMGWGYHLVAMELAVLYVESNGEDSEAVNKFADDHGTSGNQHDFAKSMARQYKEGPPDES